MSIRTIEGSLERGPGRFALVVGRWNGSVAERLKEGAIGALRRHGVSDENITVIYAPGAFEIPLACKMAAASGEHDAIIALGAVIRGATPHFEYVAGECARGVSRVSGEYGLPVAFGVLTVDSLEQAIERAGPCEGGTAGEGGQAGGGGGGGKRKVANKGEEAALAALEMASLRRQVLPESALARGG